MHRAILCFLLLIPFSAAAQESKIQVPLASKTQEEPKERLRIGVALEGGGALDWRISVCSNGSNSTIFQWTMLPERAWAASSEDSTLRE